MECSRGSSSHRVNDYSVSNGSQADRLNNSINESDKDANDDQDGDLMDGQSVGESGNTPVHKVKRRLHVVR